MDKTVKRQIESFILSYLEKRIPNFKPKNKFFTCPFCNKESANIFPISSYKVHCYSPECGKLGNIFDISRKLDFNNSDVSDEEIAGFLKYELNITSLQEIDELYIKYYNWGWDLVPVSKNSKASDVEKEWQKKNHKDINEWKQWYENGLNHGLKTGKISNIIGIDFDIIPTDLKKRIYEGNPSEKMLENAKKYKDEGITKLKQQFPILWETIYQETFGGIHFFYLYDADIVKSSYDYEGIHIDIQSDGGQIVIQPSIVGGYDRKIFGNEIKKIPENIKTFILKNSKLIQKEIEDETSLMIDDSEGIIKGLQGNCNNRFVQVGGMLRKIMTVKQTEVSLGIINKYMLDTPMDFKSLKGMYQQIEKYHKVDIDNVANKIIDHLKIVKEAHIRDLKECLGFDRIDLEQALRFLCDHKRLYKVRKDLYKLIEDVEWQEDFMSIGKPLGIKIPYLENYAYFENGQFAVIGAPPGLGKSHCAINFIKKFVQNNIYPYLLSVEGGGGMRKIASTLGLKEGDFGFKIVRNPAQMPLQKNAITIIDWLKAPDGEHAKTDVMYEQLNDQLIEKGGWALVFAQLKRFTDKKGTIHYQFYAQDMLLQYASFVGKFLYPVNSGIGDNLNPYIETLKIRDSKVGKSFVQIPLKFDEKTKLLELKNENINK